MAVYQRISFLILYRSFSFSDKMVVIVIILHSSNWQHFHAWVVAHSRATLLPHMHQCIYTYSACTCLPSYVCIYFIVHSSGVTVRYEEEQYTAAEEAGYVTLVLVLDGDAVIPVTVSVNTLDLVNSSVGDAATGELATHWALSMYSAAYTHEHTATNLHPVMFCSMYSLINIFTSIPRKYSSDDYYFIKTPLRHPLQCK